MTEPPQTPAAIVEALRRDLAAVLEDLPSAADSALRYQPLPEEEAQ